MSRLFLHSVNHAVSATIACSFQTGVTCKQELQEIIVRVSQMNESLVGTFPCLVCYFLSDHVKSDTCIPEKYRRPDVVDLVHNGSEEIACGTYSIPIESVSAVDICP